MTTHDIAKEADISSGNLYYHYKNKQVIIREIFSRIEIFSVTEWWENGPSNRDVRFVDFMQFYFGSLVKYRFFFREFSMLIMHDSVLAREWKQSYAHLMTVMKEALAGWVKQGLIKPFATAETAEIFIETVWIIAAFSQVHLESTRGKQNSSERARGRSEQMDQTPDVRYLARFLYPYHTPKGQRVIDLYL